MAEHTLSLTMRVVWYERVCSLSCGEMPLDSLYLAMHVLPLAL